MFIGGFHGGPQKKVDRATVRRVFALFKPYGLQTTWIVVFVLLSAGIGILTPFFLKEIINDGLVKNDLNVVAKYTILSLVATLGSFRNSAISIRLQNGLVSF